MAKGRCPQFPYCPIQLNSIQLHRMTEEVFHPQPSNILDLHNFRFEETESLLEEFIWSCMKNGFKEGSIIHGKGTGRQRDLVHQKLKSHPDVYSFELAGGNWGKTIFKIRNFD